MSLNDHACTVDRVLTLPSPVVETADIGHVALARTAKEHALRAVALSWVALSVVTWLNLPVSAAARLARSDFAEFRSNSVKLAHHSVNCCQESANRLKPALAMTMNITSRRYGTRNPKNYERSALGLRHRRRFVASTAPPKPYG